MKFSLSGFIPLRRVGHEHLIWKQKVDLERKSNAVYLCLRSIERSVAEGKVQAELIPSLMDLGDDWMVTSLTSVRTPLQNLESAIQIYEKFPSNAFRVSGVHGQRRAYKAPWAQTSLNLYQASPPTPRLTKQQLIKSKINSARNRLAKRREKLSIQRLSGTLKSYQKCRVTSEILSPRYQQPTEKTHPKGIFSISSRKDLAICMQVPYPRGD